MTFKAGVGRAVALVGCGSLHPPPPPATWPTCLPILIVSIDVSIVSIVNIDVIMNGRGRSWQGLSHHFLSRRLTCYGGVQFFRKLQYNIRYCPVQSMWINSGVIH